MDIVVWKVRCSDFVYVKSDVPKETGVVIVVGDESEDVVVLCWGCVQGYRFVVCHVMFSI